MTAVPIVTHVAGATDEYLYPALGDPKPPGGAKVLLLTKGGICVTGPWTGDSFYLGWAPMPKRNKEKEALLHEPHHQAAAGRHADPAEHPQSAGQP
jgi:hypothetical protein